jgi:hypothetical protein
MKILPKDELMDEKLIFRINYSLIIRYFILLNALFFFIPMIFDQELIVTMIVLLVLDVGYIFILIADTPLEMLFNRRDHTLTIRMLSLFWIRTTTFKLTEITYTYQVEIGGKGSKSRVFRLFDLSGKTKLVIWETSKGWSEKELRNICQTIDLLKA